MYIHSSRSFIRIHGCHKGRHWRYSAHFHVGLLRIVSGSCHQLRCKCCRGPRLALALPLHHHRPRLPPRLHLHIRRRCSWWGQLQPHRHRFLLRRRPRPRHPFLHGPSFSCSGLSLSLSFLLISNLLILSGICLPFYG